MTESTHPEAHGHMSEVDQKLEGLQSEIAEATASLRKKETGVMLATTVAGGAVGLMTGDPALIMMGGMGGFAGGALVTDFIFAKEKKNLQLSEKRFDAELSGPEAQNWGKYYANAAQGHDVPAPPPMFASRRHAPAQIRGGGSPT